MGGRKVTQKALTSKKGPVHPNSRRATQQTRIGLRTAKLEAAKRARRKGSSAKIERIISLVLLLPPDLANIPDRGYLHAFLQSSFLERNADEVKELEAQRRPGRPAPPRLALLKDASARERSEYENGIDIPDLMSEANVSLLREWDGDPQALHMFRFVRVMGKDQSHYQIVQKGSHKDIEEEDKQLAAAGRGVGEATSTARPSPMQR